MKRVISSILCILMVLGISAAAFTSAFAAGISTMPSEQDVISIVGLLEIMNGDGYGNLNLDNKVTRAEFVKMAISASALKDKVNSGSSVSPFTDVRVSHWAVGYITAAVSNNYIKGYLDGSFKPDNEVTLEEAVTVMLRIMGYSELDSGKYPETQLAKYEELEMDNRISAVRGEPLTRRECMYLMYNALCAKEKSGKIYCEALGYATDENGRIDYLALMSSKMDGPVVVYDDTYKSAIGFDLEAGTVYRNNKKATAADISKYDVVYYNNKIKTAWCFSDKEIGIVDSVTVSGITSNASDYEGTGAANESVIVSGKSYKLGNKSVSYKFSAYGTFAPDDFVMLLLDKDRNVADVVLANSEIYEAYAEPDDDKVALINSTLKGPYIVTDTVSFENSIPFPLSSGKIYDGTKEVDLSYIKADDVYYYSEAFACVWLYRDTVTGFVSAVTPSRENPTSVNVGGKNYTLDGAEIKRQFSNFGTYEVDDFVTLLIGNGGTAVLARDGDIYGYANSNDDNISYADLVNQSMKGPVIVGTDSAWKSEIPFDISTATVYRKNSEADADSVAAYDVLYYSEPFKTVWIYSDKATGVIDAIAPNRISPASVTISGYSYSFESTGASFKVSNLGSFNTGDTVTVLLGKNGGVVDVISGTELAEATYGFVTGFSEKEFTRTNGTKYTAETVAIMGIDTKNYSYQYDGSYLDKGDFVSVTYRDGEPYIAVAKSNITTAQAQNINALIAAGKISDTANLLDVYITGDTDSLENKSVDYVTVHPARLSGAKLQSSEIYYAEIKDGEIKTLVLKNFTGDIHSYGVITAERSSGKTVYTMVSGGTEMSGSINTAYGTPTIGAARFVKRAGEYIVTSLEGVKVDKDGFMRGYCISDGTTYNYAANVEYYIKENSREFTATTYDDIAEGSYTIKAYYDKPQASGGRIRVIIAE